MIKQNLYKKCKEQFPEILTKDRWSNGIPHHEMSKKIMEFISEHDFRDYQDHFCWKYGGDGDNGESLMYQLDAFFEFMDKETNKKETKL